MPLHIVHLAIKQINIGQRNLWQETIPFYAKANFLDDANVRYKHIELPIHNTAAMITQTRPFQALA